MNTLPPVPFEEHIQNLRDWLRQRVPDIDTMMLQFYDHHDLEREHDRWTLPATALRDMDSMRLLFERLCQQGREWINLAGDGKMPQGGYLISVEYSEASGHSATYVNLAGPSLNPDGSVAEWSHILIRK